MISFLCSSWHNSCGVKRKCWKWNLFCTGGVSEPGDTSLFVCCNLALLLLRLFSKKMQPFDGKYEIAVLDWYPAKDSSQKMETKMVLKWNWKEPCCWWRKPGVHLLHFEVSRSPRKEPSLPEDLIGMLMMMKYIDTQHFFTTTHTGCLQTKVPQWFWSYFCSRSWFPLFHIVKSKCRACFIKPPKTYPFRISSALKTLREAIN